MLIDARDLASKIGIAAEEGTRAMPSPANREREPVNTDAPQTGSGQSVAETTSVRSFRGRVASWRAGNKFWLSVSAAATVLGVLVAIAFYGAWESNRVEVPDVKEMTLQRANTELTALGIAGKSEKSIEPDFAKFYDVVDQKPAAGTRVDLSSVITLVAEPLSNPVPSVVGQSYAGAERSLRASGFLVAPVKFELPPELDAHTENLGSLLESEFGLVLDNGSVRGAPATDVISRWTVAAQGSDAQSTMDAGTDIALTLEVPVAVTPNVVGMSYTDATTALSAVGLAAHSDLTSYSVPNHIPGAEGVLVGKPLPPGFEAWRVSTQSTPAGVAHIRGDSILLTVEWATVPVPSIVDLTKAAAESALTDLGFVPEVEIPNPDDWRVYKQNPGPGTEMLWGSAVQYGVMRPPSGTIEFQVIGNGSKATITWASPNSFSIQQDTEAGLPWSKVFDNFDHIDSYERGNFNAQSLNGDSITCRMLVNGQVVIEHTSKGRYAVVSCG